MADFSKLQNIYWRIRYQRRKNQKRKYYRYAAAEKKRLIASGVDPEELRLLCRALAKQHCEHAERRLEAYRLKVTQDPISSLILCVCQLPIIYIMLNYAIVETTLEENPISLPSSWIEFSMGGKISALIN